MHQCLELTHIIFPFSANFFFDEVILVDTNRKIKCPDIEFGEFLQFVGICMFMTENSGTNWVDYFRKTL